MWTLFLVKNDPTYIVQAIKNVQKEVLEYNTKEVKKYFSEKAVIYFDNNRLLKKAEGLHENLLEALSHAEKEFAKDLNDDTIFPTVHYYWFSEYGKNVVAIDNTLPYLIDIFLKNGFTVYQKGILAFPEKELDIQYQSFNGLLFDISFINFAKNWVDFIPEFEQRCILQTNYIIKNSILKKLIKSGTTEDLLAKTTEEQLRKDPKYNELLAKIKKQMPAIEKELIINWEETPVNVVKKVYRKRLKV